MSTELYYSEKIKYSFASALPLEEVFDPTGAGDILAGGLAGYIAASRHISRPIKKRTYSWSQPCFVLRSETETERMENLKSEEAKKRLQSFKDLNSLYCRT